MTRRRILNPEPPTFELQTLRYLFLERVWETDKHQITRCVQNLQRDGGTGSTTPQHHPLYHPS